MFCPHCGAELPHNAAFCGYCGRPLPVPSEPPADKETPDASLGAQAAKTDAADEVPVDEAPADDAPVGEDAAQARKTPFSPKFCVKRLADLCRRAWGIMVQIACNARAA